MKNTGQILRSRKNGKSRYTPISNDILQSEIMTPEEKSILVHLLSLPEDWVVYKGEIWRKMNMGRERFNKNWKLLVEKGYIISIRLIDTNTNLVNGWNHIVYEEPVLNENEIDQSSDLPNSGQSEEWGVYKGIIEQSNNLKKEEERKHTKSRIVFVVPTIEDVKEYMTEIGIPEKSERFYNYYQSNGWMVGKNSMKDWKAAARNFRNDKTKTPILPNNLKVF
jgi:hypothetical protein